mmetsp:Transcript_18480/g.29108  ORF Transcript_18480/g.29108 Transcript_18480/m.29108 type:complete len:210 (+) Transcript_18480:135-764(+)
MSKQQGKTKTVYDFTVKLLLIGDSSVGKSCLLLRYCEDFFQSARISTIGVDFKIKSLQIDGKKIKLQIWDTAGQERFRTMTTAYYRGADGILLIYDVANRDSFENVSRWIEQIDQHAGTQCHRALVANKSDLAPAQWAVSEAEGKELAAQFNIPFFMTSAKTNNGVQNAFLSLTQSCVVSAEAKASREKQEATIKLAASKPSSVKSKCC